MTVMIPRNTTIPTQKKEIFSTATDNQPSVEIHVLQGERAESKYNRALGKFHLEGIMAAPRGVPKVEVTFDIDANGILYVSAKDTATGKDQKITITANSGLNEAEIQKMVYDAAAHEREDKERKEQIERRNKLDNLCYTLEKTLERKQRQGSRLRISRLSMGSSRRARGRREAGRRPSARCNGAPREGSAPPRERDVRGQRLSGRPRRAVLEPTAPTVDRCPRTRATRRAKKAASSTRSSKRPAADSVVAADS